MIMSENRYTEQQPAGNGLYDIKEVNRKFPIGLWVLRYYPPAAQHKLGSPWIGPNQIVKCHPRSKVQGQEVNYETIYDLLYVFHINFGHSMHHF